MGSPAPSLHPVTERAKHLSKTARAEAKVLGSSERPLGVMAAPTKPRPGSVSSVMVPPSRAGPPPLALLALAMPRRAAKEKGRSAIPRLYDELVSRSFGDGRRKGVDWPWRPGDLSRPSC